MRAQGNVIWEAVSELQQKTRRSGILQSQPYGASRGHNPSNCRGFWTSATLSRVKSGNSHRDGPLGAAILVTVDAVGHKKPENAVIFKFQIVFSSFKLVSK